MNSYESRRLAMLKKRKEYNRRQWESKRILVDKIISAYEEAYLAYFGKRITVTYRLGWYRVRGRGVFREANIVNMTNRMWAELQELPDNPT